MKKNSNRCKTVFCSDVIDKDCADILYLTLRDEIEWEEGVRSKKGFTRKAKSVQMGTYPDVDSVILKGLQKLGQYNYDVLGYYLNYYENGDMWTPNHSHAGSHQLVISLGATRKLTMGKRSFEMTSGSGIIFGGSSHGVPKDDKVKEGRISIATFMLPDGK